MSVYTQLGICILLAGLPVGVWGYIFYKKSPFSKYLTAITFLTGGLSVFPILLYKYSWNYFPWMNAFRYAERLSGYHIAISDVLIVPLSVLATFMIVGVIEEWMKHYTVRVVDDKCLRSIDDAIVLSIIAALGFAFVENILYFFDIWLTHGAGDLVLPFIFRSLFSTFAHVMFSGIFGYFYGVGHFASERLQTEIRVSRRTHVRFFHRIFGFFTSDLFYKEKILEGLILASVLHAVFNVALELNLAYVLVPFLSVGYLILDYLLKQKQNHEVHHKLAPEYYAVQID